MTPDASTDTSIQISDRAWKALEGAYDLQVHVGPDVIARRIDDIDCAKEFLAHRMKGFVLKSHYVQTGERAQVVTKAVPGSKVFGALTLNHSVGGLNPVAVEIAGRTGCKIVWMPTVDAENETAGRLDGGTEKLPFWAKIQRELAADGVAPPPLSVIDRSGSLLDPARRCLERIARHNMIRATGVSRTLISTDLGQTINPPVAEGFAMFAQRLLDAGFSPGEVRTMAVTIPTRLVEE